MVRDAPSGIGRCWLLQRLSTGQLIGHSTHSVMFFLTGAVTDTSMGGRNRI